MAIAIDYEVGGTVFVAYPFPSSNYFKAVSRIVKQVNVTDTGDEAIVSFDTGANVLDSNATPTVFLTEALADAALVTDVISRSAAAVASDATTSEVSTAGQASTTLGRIG